MKSYFFQKILFVSLGTLFFSTGALYLYSLNRPSSSPADQKMITQASLIRPRPHYHPQVQHYVKVKLEIRENPDPLADKIIRVHLAGRNIPLRPANPTGNRGTAHLQLKPGKYMLEWKVKKQRHSWPRYAIYKEKVDIPSQAIWIDLLLDRDKAFVRY